MKEEVLLGSVVLILLFQDSYCLIERKYDFNIHYRVSLPTEVTKCEEVEKQSHMDCFRSCTANLNCSFVYIASVVQTGYRDGWKCSLCEHVDVGPYSSGNGIFALITRYSTPRQVPNAAWTSTKIINGVKAAIFTCSGTEAKSLKIAFNKKKGIWPQLPQVCLNSMCQQRSLSACLVTVSIPEDSTTITANSMCEADETPDGSVTCDQYGTWTISDSSKMKVMCISPRCFRMNIENRAVYKGTVSTTTHGLTCQAWNKHVPHHNNFMDTRRFPEDNSNLNHNYCRDPEPSGFLWCYTTSATRWQTCGNVLVCT